MSFSGQTAYFTLMLVVAMYYYLAVVTSPGTPPPGYTTPPNEWKKWCNKCDRYKPPRTHHCKQCNTCVLRMDHHCPWTNNCVGHGNTPHFFRFLLATLVGTGYTLYRLGLRAVAFYGERHLPAYLIRKTELAAVVVLVLVDLAVFLSIFVLFVRCFIHLAGGKTQIEVWETERIESQFHTPRLWLQIRKNYKWLHGKELGELSSWNPLAGLYKEDMDEQIDSEVDHEEIEMNDRTEPGPEEESPVPKNFFPDDVIFPYDLGFFKNLEAGLGLAGQFLLPWGRPVGNGYEFDKNDDDDQLNLPWPPDGGPNEFLHAQQDVDRLARLRNYTAIRQQLDPRATVERSHWMNDMGETLNDYGVDVDGEDNAVLERPQ